MIKIAHEAPTSIFKTVQAMTDYDYCLVHLMDENPRYRDQFLHAAADGREIILDNSLFELGTAYDETMFRDWIWKLKPTWYVIPDVFANAQDTIRNIKNWKTGGLPGKTIGVAQGSSVKEVVDCYLEIKDYVDMVAFSFAYDFFVDPDSDLPMEAQWMVGRGLMLTDMYTTGIMDQSKKHHILGCTLPQEYKAYRSMNCIYSCDTSNPVVAGISGVRYNGTGGLDTKIKTKLFKMIDNYITDEGVEDVKYNITQFRKIVRGDE